jgi:hypothetical protein
MVTNMAAPGQVLAGRCGVIRHLLGPACHKLVEDPERDGAAAQYNPVEGRALVVAVLLHRKPAAAERDQP